MTNETTNPERKSYRVTTETPRGNAGPSETTMDVVAASEQEAVEIWAKELRGERAYAKLTAVHTTSGGYRFTAKV